MLFTKSANAEIEWRWLHIFILNVKTKLLKNKTTNLLKHEIQYKLVDIWAISHENVSSEIFDQVRFKPACSATEAS